MRGPLAEIGHRHRGYCELDGPHGGELATMLSCLVARLLYQAYALVPVDEMQVGATAARQGGAPSWPAFGFLGVR